jgi:hypothetical protein
MPRPRLQRAATARREKVQLCIREQSLLQLGTCSRDQGMSIVSPTGKC